MKAVTGPKGNCFRFINIALISPKDYNLIIHNMATKCKESNGKVVLIDAVKLIPLYAESKQRHCRVYATKAVKLIPLYAESKQRHLSLIHISEPTRRS